jgi:heptosyltransferase II
MSGNILIIKLGAIGDVVMALPLIPAIKSSKPHTHITWVCGKSVAPIMQMVHGIDRLVVVDDTAILTGSLFARLKEIAGLWMALSGKAYDLIINAYQDKRYRILTLPLKYTNYASFMGDKPGHKFIKGRYHGVEFVRLYNPEVSPEEVLRYPDIALPLQAPILDSIDFHASKHVIIAAGGAKNILNDDDLRRWNIDSYVALARELNSKGYKIILTGAENDSWVSQHFDNIPLYDLIGKTSLPDLLYLLSKVDLLITHDTGILHLAKLTKTKTIGLFGPVDPRERVGKSDPVSIIWEPKDLPCAPCYDGKRFAVCSDNRCMKNISVGLVLSKISD